MKKTAFFLAAAFGILGAASTRAGIIQTSTYNGHTYHLLDRTNTWQESENEAIGLGGHLVTVNDAAEDAWIFATFAQTALDNSRDTTGILPAGVVPSIWIGYIRDPHTSPPAPSLSDWYWVSGEASTYTNWATGEPTMSLTELTSGVLVVDLGARVAGQWHDIYVPHSPGNFDYGLVEVNAVPEPGSLTLLSLGALGLAGASLRRRQAS